MIPLPPPTYMDALARVIYAVTYLEGLIIWDIASVSTQLPPEFETRLIVTKTTGGIGHYLVKHASKVSNSTFQSWIYAGGTALIDVTDDRNDVLHARPVTAPSGQQQLQRFHWVEGPKDSAGKVTWVQRDFPIDEAALLALEAKIHSHIATLSTTRFV